jgi:cell shape-determining protein MreC
MVKTIFKAKSLQPLLLLFLGIVLVFIGRFEVSDIIRRPLSYVFEPVSFTAHSTGSSLNNWGIALFDASSYIDDYERIRKELLELKSKELTTLDYQEYRALKLHSSLLNKEAEYISSQVINYTEKGEIFINKGLSDGIKEGNVVVLGNIFVGVVTKADLNGSIVRLPTNRSSSYEVVLLPSSFEVEQELALDGFVLSTGVVSGSSNSINIDNIGINSKVSEGDLVVLRDERIGELLILGRLVGLSRNPASTSQSGYVSPVFDYNNLLNVFIRVN